MREVKVLPSNYALGYPLTAPLTTAPQAPASPAPQPEQPDLLVPRPTNPEPNPDEQTELIPETPTKGPGLFKPQTLLTPPAPSDDKRGKESGEPASPLAPEQDLTPDLPITGVGLFKPQEPTSVPPKWDGSKIVYVAGVKIKDELRNTNYESQITATGVFWRRGLTVGNRGEDVRRLQTLLASIPGIYPEQRATGYFGLLTQDAVARFHDKYNLAKPGDPGYGYAGPKTRVKLRELFGE